MPTIKVGLLLCCAALVFVSTACASSIGSAMSGNSLDNHVVFRPPRGWQRRTRFALRPPPGLTVGGRWANATSDLQTISYGYGPVPDNLRNAARSPRDARALAAAMMNLAKHYPIGTVLESRPISLCEGTHPGWYFKTRTSLIGFTMDAETVQIVGPSVLATATYIRPGDAVPDKSAERALSTLCVR
jgi:hypothetical protein